MKNRILMILLALSLVFSSISFAFGAVDPNATLVNPVNNSSITSNNLLVSVKVTQPKNIKVSVYEMKKYGSSLGESDMRAICSGSYDTSGVTYTTVSSENFSTNSKLSFYTKKLENVNTGVYLVRVDTISQDKVVYSSRSYVTVKSKGASEKGLFDSAQSGTAAFLQSLIKSIFGN